MIFVLIILLSLGWGVACGIVIPNPYVSLTVALVGGFAIGYFLPTLFGV